MKIMERGYWSLFLVDIDGPSEVLFLCIERRD